jgi:rare lipoprotein A (peptidoglycan hydrolase)
VTVTVPSTTTTTAPTTTTTEAPATTTTAPPRTTTTAPPRTTTTAAPAPPPPPAPSGNSEWGEATWYAYRDGECAHKTLPRGTTVHITNLANGATATCVVTDRGPYGGNRIIDLDDDTFAQLAPLSTGIIDVTITW